jgi:Spy/CpxP family protein refolding chaperone
MTLLNTRKSILAIAAFALSGTIALAQQPTQSPAPIERQGQGDPMQGPEMHHGMSPGGMHGGQSGFRGQGMDMSSKFHGGPGGFGGMRGGGSESHGMEGGFHIGPGGMWWKNPMIVQRLTLTPEQGRKMDGIFQESRLQLIDLKANVEKQEVILEPLLSANPLDSARAMDQIDKVAQSRADLEKASAKMLLGIRSVLTPEQWTKLNDRRGPGEMEVQARSAAQGSGSRTRGLHSNPSNGTSPNARPSSGMTPQ